MRDPELWERLRTQPLDDAFLADVTTLQKGNAQETSALVQAFRKYLYLSFISDRPAAVPTLLTPVLEAYLERIDHDAQRPTVDRDASLGDLLALYQLEFDERPPPGLWGEKTEVQAPSGIPPLAWGLAGLLAFCGAVLAFFGQWWFFVPVLLALLVLAGWGKKGRIVKPYFDYDGPPAEGGGGAV